MNKDDTLVRGVGLWLKHHVDSHTIYGAPMLEKLQEIGIGVRFTKNKVHGNFVVFSAPTKPQPCMMPLETHAQVEASIKRRGLGGTLAPDDGTLMFTGYVLSGTLCRWLLGDDPGDGFFGRGSAHRASVDALVNA